MKQILQSLATGQTDVAEIPCPAVKPGHVLIRTTTSLISSGTERMLIDFSRSSMISKVKAHPDKVKQVMQKIRTDGLATTIAAIRSKLDQPIPLGYCNVGEVMEVGEGVTEFHVGQRVVSNGNHAEVVCIPKNLVAAIPEGVSDEEAAFTVLGAIAIQGVRLTQASVGENIVVAGLGLIGLITVQILRESGCRVMGIDMDARRCEMARAMGADAVVNLGAGEDPISAAQAFSRGQGVDAVILTAATKSSEPVHQAAEMCRKRGKIVLVGVTGLELDRSDFYEKEITFQVSCSYGPGRYDPTYEQGGQDYPLGFVRWTAKRNFEAVLDLIATQRLKLSSLVSHRLPFQQADAAYDLVQRGSEALGIMLQYPNWIERTNEALRERTVAHAVVQLEDAKRHIGTPKVAVIGAGNYAVSTLLPALKSCNAKLQSICSTTGVSSYQAAKRFGFAESTTDLAKLLASEGNNAVVISTRHDSHANLVIQALQEGKHVFVEKPLCLTRDELRDIQRAYDNAPGSPIVMVGFNRRFAPQVVKMKQLLGQVQAPKSILITVNAGYLPADHWTQDSKIGGGRIIGEGCHFVDLALHLAGAPVVSVQANAMGRAPGVETCEDKATILMQFADGSTATILYLANGHKSFPKERIEVFVNGRILQLDNFRKLSGFGWSNFRGMNLRRQDKGNATCIQAWINAISSGANSPIAFSELVAGAEATFQAAEAISESLGMKESKRAA